MWNTKIFEAPDLGLSIPFLFTKLSDIALPRLTLKGELLDISGSLRATFQLTKNSGGGGHGILEECWRYSDTTKRLVLQKRPRVPEVKLLTEAFIQWLAHKTLAAHNLGSRIPAVQDIYTQPDRTVAFSMLEVQNATLATTYLATCEYPDDVFHILAQTAAIMYLLEDLIHLDHRDLKADNLLIIPTPSTLFLKNTCIKSRFTVLIVDFGFACLGESNGFSSVDASVGTLPPLDPCPKEGRDLFHLIVSLYGVEQIRNRFSPATLALFEELMVVNGKPTHSLARRYSHSNWIYLMTSEKTFTHTSCTPESILKKLVEKRLL
jgi:serine/threonine protein kinase